MQPKCLQMLEKQDFFQNYIFFDEMCSDHRRTWKKLLSNIYLMQLQLLLCILPQALPGINALKNLNLLTLECTLWNQFAIEEVKKKSLLLYSFISHFSSPKSYSLFFSQGTPPEAALVKDPVQNTARLREKKNLWHFDVNWTVHCRSLFAFTARKVLWATELRPRCQKPQLHKFS